MPQLITPDLTGFLTAPRALPHAQHVFGTREHAQPDSNATVRAYTERLGPIAHMRQVHGNRVVRVGNSGLVEECDAIYTDVPGLWLAAKSADCVPVLLSAPGAVAAIHAGWRGLQAEVIRATIEKLQWHFGIQPDEIHAAIGPCISQPHYEVEGTFADLFEPEFINPSENPGRVMLNLPAVAHNHLHEAGVPLSQIGSLNRCTYAEAGTFNSYRRYKQGKDETYAVQLSLIRLTPKP